MENSNLIHVGYRWSYEGENDSKWSVVKHIPKWYKLFMKDVILEKIYAIKEKN